MPAMIPKTMRIVRKKKVLSKSKIGRRSANAVQGIKWADEKRAENETRQDKTIPKIQITKYINPSKR